MCTNGYEMIQSLSINEIAAPKSSQNLLANIIKMNAAASTQDQAQSAILFSYKDVLGIELPWIKNAKRAKKSEKLPVVFSKNEVVSEQLPLLICAAGSHFTVTRLQKESLTITTVGR